MSYMRSPCAPFVWRPAGAMAPPQGAIESVSEKQKSWRERRHFSSSVQMSVVFTILAAVDVFKGLLALLSKHQRIRIYINSFNELNVPLLKK